MRRDLPYEPHITLARHARFEDLESAFVEAQDRFGGEYGDVLREVTLLSVGGGGKMARLGTFSLNTA